VSLAVKQRLWFLHHKAPAPCGNSVQQWLNMTYPTVTMKSPLFDHLILYIPDVDVYPKNTLTYNVSDFFLKKGNHIMETLC
jgi:hypothetical protein